MKEQIIREGWPDRVQLLGRRNDVPSLMASSDLLVHPARIEGFGLVLAEAMAAGLPVVASNVQGIPEVLAETDSLMVPPDDPNALREAVLKTLNRTPEEATRAVEKGRKRAEAFRIDKRTDAMVRLFEDVLAGRF
jgi:glycosyltransferase involved in cell wall biosynthesis